MTNSISFKITSEETFTDFTELNQEFSNAATYGPVLEGFQVNFVVDVTFNGEEKSFEVIYQSEERNNGMMAYNGYEMAVATIYGCDADESQELLAFIEDDYTVLDALNKRANQLAKEQLESMI
ncbi:hypothetical protein MSP8886_01422 [Marinomonas spartinae]|uniref:Uncharacterized protein n=1 Tax=Marinomonas spartinae TaxID=1792290 RepID=A0A1A8T8Q2_9GAMM|nr:hypothetical protein [Marinomonas spartinae]SBS29062.1 hypothetical protein MSP8886_01422 [Marinomonas spartinae]